jgi:2-polyprenyl-3-methyl-5-hydroxy-6-metoxy-1,4-benzoquinol methylase
MRINSYRWNNARPSRVHEYIMDPVLSMMPSGCALKIADLGCGNGFLSGVFAAMGHDVTALDSSREGTAIAKKRYPSLNVHCLSVYDEIGEIIGRDFDVVISSEVIEHLYDPRTLLKNAREILKDGGMLILTTPYHGYIKNFAMAITGRLDSHLAPGWDGGHIKFFSVKTLREMVSEQGFRHLRFKFAGRLPFLWKSMIVRAVK